MTIFDIVIILASIAEHPSFLENIRFQGVGLVLVVLALGFIAFVVSLTGRLFKRIEKRKPSPVASAVPEQLLALAQAEDPHVLIAVITASVYSVIKESHRIISIKPVVNGKVLGELYLQAWSVEGRRQHLASHKVR